MAAGGAWVVQNKQRPGAYINFVSKPSAVGTVGDRGVVAVALPMTWGPQNALIELYGTDLLDGASLTKVGCTAFDTDESLPYRLALSGASKALLFRADSAGTAASAILAGTGVTLVKFTAKYLGTTGNKLSVKITAAVPTAPQSTVEILFNGAMQETFVVTTATPTTLTAITSQWGVFTIGASVVTIPATTGTPCISGLNGAVVESDYATFFNLITVQNFQAVAIDSSSGTVPALIEAKVRSMRDSLGRKVQGVVYNSVASDYEGIIAIKQGYKTVTDTIPVNLFPVYVASITAGADINVSKTGFVIPGATEIINPIAENDIAAALAAGWFVISYRQDGAVCVEQDINTFHSFTAVKDYAFCKNRVIRCLDAIGNGVALIFARNYLGKIDNNATGRNLYKSEIISFMETLQGINAISEFAGPEDVEVLPGVAIDAVVVNLGVKPVDSMEKLYMTVTVDATV